MVKSVADTFIEYVEVEIGDQEVYIFSTRFERCVYSLVCTRILALVQKKSFAKLSLEKEVELP